jgi:hypothetical protein
MLSLLDASVQPSTEDDDNDRRRGGVRVEELEDKEPSLPATSSNGIIMRPISQIRRDEKIGIPVNKDSLYKPIVRVQREFKKMMVPKKLQVYLYI